MFFANSLFASKAFDQTFHLLLFVLLKVLFLMNLAK